MNGYEQYRIEQLEKKVEKLERKVEGGSPVGCLMWILALVILAALIFGQLWMGGKVPDSVAIETVEAYGFANPVILERENGLVHLNIIYNVEFTVEATNLFGQTVILQVFSGYPRMITTIGIEGKPE